MIQNQTLAKSEKTHVRTLFSLCKYRDKERSAALENLWARFDARQDLEHRVPMFHISARYWEGRWLKDALKNKNAKVSNQEQLKRAMMLGVVIVATTHKIQGLGKTQTADLLVMDEAGQCLPEVAVSCLALCKTAVFVGDTKQLQPISLLSAEKVDQIAGLFGIKPHQLPPSFNSRTGSAMTVAQKGTHLYDGGEDCGITLLYHYRCHPAIIGYCNQLLYRGAMHIVRENTPTLSTLPPMSWVDVSGTKPQAQGSSWTNEAEILEIVRWIEYSHQKLCTAYGKPLDQILAIITPLSPQAKLGKKILQEKLSACIASDVLDRMIIGTVHQLQGAERPIVIFSLVQQLKSNPSIFADRDGGFLMNVAVSRAKDAFIVFAERATLKPTKFDKTSEIKASNGPIAQLGEYLCAHGTRLYPRSLVIVEAPNKKASIKRALGLQIEVLATQGNLMASEFRPDGTLTWTLTSEVPKDFVPSLVTQNGLLDEIVIATDDDIAGELIGWQVATLASEYLPPTIPVRRMRFHSMESDELQLSFQIAGKNFDTSMLSAALLRECARHHDKNIFESLLPKTQYVSAPRRDLIAAVASVSQETRQSLMLTIADDQGNEYTGFVPVDGSALAEPQTFTDVEAKVLAKNLVNSKLELRTTQSVTQIPELYPSSTTLRILSVAADELNILPWDAQDHLNALYQEGGN